MSDKPQSFDERIIEIMATGVAERRGWRWPQLPKERAEPKCARPDQNEYRYEASLYRSALREAGFEVVPREPTDWINTSEIGSPAVGEHGDG